MFDNDNSNDKIKIEGINDIIDSAINLFENIEITTEHINDINNSFHDVGETMNNINDTIGNNMDSIIKCFNNLNSNLERINSTLNIIAISIVENTNTIKEFKKKE